MHKAIFSLLILAASCAAQPGPSPVPPAPPAPIDTELCGDAQKNLEKVCPARSKTPAGKPFGQYCREAQGDNQIALNPKCLAAAKNCQEAEVCPQQ
jgi:hypothetical protein